MCAPRREADVPPPREEPDLPCTTVFSGAGFCGAWAATYGFEWEPLDGSADRGLLFTESRRLGLRDYQLAPGGLSWTGGEDEAAAVCALRQIRARRTRRATWNFRYDARGALDAVARELGPGRCEIRESYMHVVPIERRAFGDVVERQVKPVRRREIRYAAERGSEIRAIETQADHEAHDALYRRWAESQGIRRHPPELYPRLADGLGRSSVFLGAWAGGDLLAALLMFRDRREWFYWHGVRDPDKDRHFAITGLLARALREACESGASYFNLGASSGIRSLEFFKESWGAERRTVWSLRWTDPRWKSVMSLLRPFRRRPRAR
jgi:hypothetical protein